MKLIDLNISGFGKFHDVGMEFEDGINIIYGKNEAGKSTIHTFIRGMLFGIEKKPGRASRTDLYTKYEPWEKSGDYEGRLRFSYQGKVYRIERVFRKAAKSLNIVNETDGVQLSNPKAFLSEALGGLSETAFTNTVSIGQLKCATDAGMANELRNYIANLNTSGDMSLNITSASDYLKKQRRSFEARLVPEAARTYSALIGEIRNIEREISQPEYENQLTHFAQLKDDADARFSDMQDQRETLLQKIAVSEQVLKLSGLHSQAEIAECRRDADEVYGAWQNASYEHGRRGRAILPVLMLFLCAVSLACAFTGLMTAYPQLAGRLGLGGIPAALPGLAAFLGSFFMQPGILCAALGLIALIFAGGALFAALGNARVSKDLRQTTETLGNLLCAQLGSADISEEAMQAFHARLDEISRLETSLLANRRQLERITGALTRLGDEERGYAQELQQQQRRQWELEQKLEHLANVKNRAEQFNRILAENDAVTQEIDAINLALETLTELSKTIRSSFGLYLNKTASDLIAGITGGAYNSISVDENLNIFMNTPQKLVPVDQVSCGAMDQIYLALRLAAAQLIQGGTERLPLIFDDSFAMYDDDRLRASLRWLLRACPSQILLFTCHRREQRLLQEAGLPYHLIELL